MSKQIPESTMPDPEEENLNDDFEDCDDDENYFEPCDNCDLPDACADFGCAIKTGVRKNYPIDGIF